LLFVNLLHRRGSSEEVRRARPRLSAFSEFMAPNTGEK